MKISDLIRKLVDIRNEHGDLQVDVNNGDEKGCHIEVATKVQVLYITHGRTAVAASILIR